MQTEAIKQDILGNQAKSKVLYIRCNHQSLSRRDADPAHAHVAMS